MSNTGSAVPRCPEIRVLTKPHAVSSPADDPGDWRGEAGRAVAEGIVELLPNDNMHEQRWGKDERRVAQIHYTTTYPR